MTEQEIITRTRTLIKRFDNLRISGPGWAGSSRLGFQFNPESGRAGHAGGGVMPPPPGDCCPRTPHHIVSDITLTVPGRGFEATIHFDDSGIADTFCPDRFCICGGCPAALIDTTGGGDGEIQHLEAIIYIKYDSGTDLWYASATAIALNGSFAIIASCSSSFETAASGCGLDESFLGPTGTISAALDYNNPSFEVATGTFDAVLT